MTEISFRKNPECTSRLREIFQDPIFAQAIAILQSGNAPVDPSASADAIASVRVLSQMTGFNTAIVKLMELSTPWETDPVIDEQSTFGLQPHEMPESV